LQVLAALFFAVSLLSPPALLAQGFVSTVAGNGATAAFGENMQATSAGLAMPQGLAFDRDGNLLIADNGSRIREVNFESGVINTVAGSTTGTPNLGFSGDGGPATSAAMLGQGIFQGVAADAQGNFYFADILNHRVRKVDANGIITTFAGNGAVIGESSLFNPHGVATDSQGNVYIADTSHSRVLKVTPSGVSATIAGTGVQGFSGDGGPATAAQLAQPCTVMVDKNGNVYIGDYGNNRVRKVNGAGIITTVAGNGSVLFTGDGGPGPSAGVSLPLGMAMDNAGNLYIADNGHDRIRKVDTAGIITTYVGSGEPVAGFEDGKEATKTRLFAPKDVVIDANGDLYFSDSGFNRVRKVSSTRPGKSLTGTFTSLSFNAAAGQVASPQQLVLIGSSSTPLSFTTSVTASGAWLTATPGNGTTPVNVRVVANPAGLAAGVYDGTVKLTPTEPQDIPLTVFVTLTVNPPAPVAGTPALPLGSVVNGASFAPFPNAIAAGAIVALFGRNLAAATVQAETIPLPTTLGATQVLMNGVAAPLFFVSAGQINAQVPWSLHGNKQVNVRVVNGNLSSNTEVSSFSDGSPGIFMLPGTTTAIVTHGADGSLVTTASPAARNEVLVLYATGLGPVTNTPASGAAGPGGPLARLRAIPVVTIGSKFATVHFAGLAPGFVALYQMNIQVPVDAPLGEAVGVQVFANGVSNVANIAVKAAP
jgi:uncharacterized protein (TIGR03437 family)